MKNLFLFCIIVLIISLVSCSPSSVECYDIPSHYPLDSECCPDENDNYMCDNEEEDVELNISVVV